MDLAYIAGLFDGEGSVFIRARQQKAQWQPGHFLVITITNNDREVLDWVGSVLGGHSKLYSHRHKDSVLWRWQATTIQAANVLVWLLPFLHIKRQQAELAIAFQHRVTSFKGHKHNPLTAEEVAWRCSQHQALCHLNKRFRLPPSD